MENKQVTLSKPFKTAFLVGCGFITAQIIFLVLLVAVGVAGALAVGGAITSAMYGLN